MPGKKKLNTKVTTIRFDLPVFEKLSLISRIWDVGKGEMVNLIVDSFVHYYQANQGDLSLATLQTSTTDNQPSNAKLREFANEWLSSENFVANKDIARLENRMQNIEKKYKELKELIINLQGLGSTAQSESDYKELKHLATQLKTNEAY